MKRHLSASCLVAAFALVLLSAPAFASQAVVTICCGPAGSVSQFQSGILSQTFASPPAAMGMASTPDGSKLIVTTSTSVQNGIPGTSNAVYVLQSSTGAVLKRIAIFYPIGEFVLDPSGTRLYATTLSPNSGAEQIISLDLKKGGISAGNIPGTGPEQLLPIGISADGATLYVPVGNKLVKFRASNLAATGSITLTSSASSAPQATPDGKTLLIATNGQSLNIIDVASGTVTANVPLSSSSAIFGAALTPDGKTLYVNGSNVVAVDVASATVKATIPAGHQNPFHIAVSPDGSKVYASDLTAATISVIDTATNTLTSTLSSLGFPYALAFDASANLLVLNADGSVAVTVDTATLQTISRTSVGSQPVPVVAPAGGTTFIANQGSGNLTALRGGAAIPVSLPSIIIPSSLAYLNNFIYASSGGLVDEINASTLAFSRTLAIPSHTAFSSTNFIATSPGSPLIYGTYVDLQIDGGPTGGGIVQYNPQTKATGFISGGSFVGQGLVVSNDATATYAFGSSFESRPFNTVASFKFGPSVTTATFPSASFVDIKISPDGSTLYVLDSNGTLDILNSSTLTLTSSVTVGTKPSVIALSADGTEALITDAASTNVYVIDLPNHTIKGTIAVGGATRGGAYPN